MSGKGYLVSAALHLLGGLLVLAFLAVLAGRFLVVDDASVAVDAIVVLGGGDPHRAYHAVALYEKGFARAVVFGGGEYKDLGIVCSSAQISLAAAEEIGLPRDVAIIAPEAQSTYDEAMNLRRLVEERGWTSLVVVTDPFHTRRSARTFRTLLPDTTVHMSAAPNPDHDPIRWWRSEVGLISVLNELIKLGFYWVKYGIAPVGG